MRVVLPQAVRGEQEHQRYVRSFRQISPVFGQLSQATRDQHILVTIGIHECPVRLCAAGRFRTGEQGHHFANTGSDIQIGTMNVSRLFPLGRPGIGNRAPLERDSKKHGPHGTLSGSGSLPDPIPSNDFQRRRQNRGQAILRQIRTGPVDPGRHQILDEARRIIATGHAALEVLLRGRDAVRVIAVAIRIDGRDRRFQTGEVIALLAGECVIPGCLIQVR